MPHPGFSAHSAKFAKHTGGLMAGLAKLESMGLSAPAMRVIAEIRSDADRLTHINVAMGAIAETMGSEAPAEAKDTGNGSGKGRTAPAA